MIEHHVELHDLHAHLFRVTLTITQPVPHEAIAMPVWIPGSYLVREFSKQVQELTATQGGKPIFITQLSKNTWSLLNDDSAPVVVSYYVYAFDASVRTAYLDATRGFFNGTSLFMRVVGHEFEPQQVEINLPKACSDWRIATGLAKRSPQLYQADDYNELVDSPFELGDFWEGSFTARGIKHRFVVSGAASSFDGKRLLADTKKIVETELAFWNGAKHKDYVFMLRAVDNGYGGLEHMNSTALIAKRSDLPRVDDASTPEGYVTLLGLISHEYFHTWNVKRLRPEGLAAYDYDRENHTELLWFFEGFTSYYDDLLLRRAGLIDDQTYLNLLAKTINQVQQTPGRLVHSLASSSYEAWTKYYRMDENSANSTVSYYTKGALVGLCLDLRLREAGGSLDAVMQRLWQRHNQEQQYDIWGIGESHIWDAIADVVLDKKAAKSIQNQLHKWVHTTVDLPLSELLANVGVETVAAPAALAQRLGVRVGTDGGLKIKQVFTGTLAAKADFAAGDEWVAVEAKDQTWRVHSLDDVALHAKAGKPITAWVARDKHVLKLSLVWPKNEMVNADVRLKIADAARLAGWLNSLF